MRHLGPEDVDALAKLCGDPRAMQYVGDGRTLTPTEVRRWIEISQQKYAERGYGTSAVIEKARDRFIGYCGVVRAPGNDFDELIYAFHVDSWGKGYATEVASAMLDYVFARSTLNEIYATIAPENAASIRVVEKLGFRFERLGVDENQLPVNYYVVGRDGWRGNRWATHPDKGDS